MIVVSSGIGGMTRLVTAPAVNGPGLVTHSLSAGGGSVVSIGRVLTGQESVNLIVGCCCGQRGRGRTAVVRSPQRRIPFHEETHRLTSVLDDVDRLEQM